MAERGVHVARVPENDRVEHQAEGAELVLLALAIGLPQLAPLAVEDDAAESVAGAGCVPKIVALIRVLVAEDATSSAVREPARPCAR